MCAHAVPQVSLALCFCWVCNSFSLDCWPGKRRLSALRLSSFALPTPTISCRFTPPHLAALLPNLFFPYPKADPGLLALNEGK